MNCERTMARSIVLTLVWCAAAFANPAGRAALAPWVVPHVDRPGNCRRLPANAPRVIHNHTESFFAEPAAIVVDALPASCAQSTARFSDLQHSLENAPGIGAAATVPSSAELTHPSRTLSRAEILAALASSAAVNQFAGLQSLLPQEIISAPAILVAEAAPKIEITRIEPDLTGTATRVRLWIPAEPRIPPFWITLHRAMTPQPSQPATTAASRGTPAKISASIVVSASANATLGDAVLVHRGKSVQLVMQATGIRITASGTALEPGREGQKIRVRSALAGKIVLATVRNAQTVDLDY
jgi:Chaperone for flagella basal body P-ring formation